MIQIRKNVFETNSSSTHSLIMCPKDEYDKWAKGKLYYCEYWPYKANRSLMKNDTNFYTEAEAKAICESANIAWDKEDDYGHCERKEHFATLDEFCDDEYLEVETYSYTTRSGEVIKAVAKYGYSG